VNALLNVSVPVFRQCSGTLEHSAGQYQGGRVFQCSAAPIGRNAGTLRPPCPEQGVYPPVLGRAGGTLEHSHFRASRNHVGARQTLPAGRCARERSGTPRRDRGTGREAVGGRDRLPGVVAACRVWPEGRAVRLGMTPSGPLVTPDGVHRGGSVSPVRDTPGCRCWVRAPGRLPVLAAPAVRLVAGRASLLCCHHRMLTNGSQQTVTNTGVRRPCHEMSYLAPTP
jgi:hypothetical protein